MISPTPIRILSVEDHPVFREGLSTIIASQPDMALVAQASNATEGMAEFRHHRPDITLMDLRLPGTNGMDALIAIRGEYPQARIIMLTTSDGDGEIQHALGERAPPPISFQRACRRTKLLGADPGRCTPENGTSHRRWRLVLPSIWPDERSDDARTGCAPALIRDGLPQQSRSRDALNDCRNHGQFPYQEPW